MRNTGFTARQRATIFHRDDFMCRRCNRWPASQIHHRCPRKLGGSKRPWINGLANGVSVCTSCHNEIESHRAEAYASGFLVREGQDLPESVPLTDLAGRTFFLTDDGSVIQATKESA